MLNDRRDVIMVTGAAGFVGQALITRLRRRWPSAEIVACDIGRNSETSADAVALNVADGAAVKEIVQRARPTAVVHLAAVSAISNATNDPVNTWQVNAIGTLNVTMAILEHAPLCHLVYVSSAEVYGRSAFTGIPVNEDALLQPANPYAVTKAAADLLVQEAAGRQLRATIVRPFNHTGPNQSENFAIPSFCKQIAEIEAGLKPPKIYVGELDDLRDFLDVQDVVSAYIGILDRSESLANGLTLNIASGEPRRIGDILDALLARTDVDIRVERDPNRVRPTRVPKITGDAGRARRLLEWAPSIPFDQTLHDTLDFWRQRIRRSSESGAAAGRP